MSQCSSGSSEKDATSRACEVWHSATEAVNCLGGPSNGEVTASARQPGVLRYACRAGSGFAVLLFGCDSDADDAASIHRGFQETRAADFVDELIRGVERIATAARHDNRLLDAVQIIR